jgi:glycosyltransferase involved in cell wall biosynthesis
MTSPLVSVLMTSYNREKYIAFAMESVLASTYTDFELIIVDDSPQSNQDIIDQYNVDKNIKYHLDNYLVKKITYNEVYNKLNKKK